MWAILKAKGEDLWTVGHYAPPGNDRGIWDWIPLQDYGTKKEAMLAVNLLNGGPVTF